MGNQMLVPEEASRGAQRRPAGAVVRQAPELQAITQQLTLLRAAYTGAYQAYEAQRLADWRAEGRRGSPPPREPGNLLANNAEATQAKQELVRNVAAIVERALPRGMDVSFRDYVTQIVVASLLPQGVTITPADMRGQGYAFGNTSTFGSPNPTFDFQTGLGASGVASLARTLNGQFRGAEPQITFGSSGTTLTISRAQEQDFARTSSLMAIPRRMDQTTG